MCPDTKALLAYVKLELFLADICYYIKINPKPITAMAKKIAQNAPIAVKLCKDAINRGIQVNIDDAIDIEAYDFGKCFSTKDQKEGMTAFIERREKNFQNK